MSTRDLTVVILNYNTRDHLRVCLDALRREGSTTASDPPGPISAEIIVVDNDSRDHSADMAEAEYPWVTVIRSGRNGGFAYGNNIALRQANGAAVMLLNPDTETPPGSIKSLYDHLQAHPEAGVVGPKLLREDGSMHMACRRSFPSPPVSLYRLTGLARLFPSSPRFGAYNLTYVDPNVELEVDSVCGACMLVRREAIEQAGLLDECFFMYGEDLDWCWRIKEAGWTVRYVPGSVVKHQHGGSSRRRPIRTTWHFFHAMDLFYRKHYLRQYNPLVSAAVLLGIYAGLGATIAKLLITPQSRRKVRV